ncbi:methyltransferase [Actinokineospora guangxiensis]|uniref:Methyltransferase n=1 Tax=Actinokineospora guangxiensis TaxID=1490288 RepID=A0ABW0EVC6_9PSEU
MSATRPGTALMPMLFGLATSQVVHVAAKLRLPDLVAAGTSDAARLAEETGTDPAALRRLLRALACLGVLVEDAPGDFAPGPLCDALRSDVPDSLHGMALVVNGPEAWRSWGRLEYSVRTGLPAWDKVVGTSHFDHLAQHPDEAAVFNAAMEQFTLAVAPQIVGAFDFSRSASVVDVGGGNGTLLAQVLASAPGVRGVLVDLGAAVVDAPRVFDAAGVADRAEVCVGDFFEHLPEGGSVYLLKSVLHDWDDEHAVRLLSSCRAAMAGDGAIVVVEPVLPDTAGPAAAGMVMSDLNMLVNTGGQERTEAEYDALFTAAGLRLRERTPIGPFDVLVAGAR